MFIIVTKHEQIRLMLSGGQIVILLSKYSKGIKNHFDTKIILIPFSISKIWEKQTWHVRSLRILKIHVLSSWKFHFVSKSMRQANNIAWKQAFLAMFSHHYDLYLEEYVPKVIWSRYQEFWPCYTFVNLIQNGFCRYAPHLLIAHLWNRVHNPNAGLRLACPSLLSHYKVWSPPAVSELKALSRFPFFLPTSLSCKIEFNSLRSAAVGKAVGLSIDWQDADYCLVFPLQQVALVQLYIYHHQSGNAVWAAS